MYPYLVQWIAVWHDSSVPLHSFHLCKCWSSLFCSSPLQLADPLCHLCLHPSFSEHSMFCPKSIQLLNVHITLTYSQNLLPFARKILVYISIIFIKLFILHRFLCSCVLLASIQKKSSPLANSKTWQWVRSASTFAFLISGTLPVFYLTAYSSHQQLSWITHCIETDS